MNTGRLTPMTDDHGDQFPGAVPPVGEHRAASSEPMVLMQAASPRQAVANASTSIRPPAGRRTPTRGQDGRRPGNGSRLGHLTRRSLRRFDQYTLEVFNPGAPYRRSDR